MGLGLWVPECQALVIRSYAVLLLLASTLLSADVPAALAQPPLGGQLVQDQLPHQPTTTVFVPPQDQSPIYLDECPEFCPPENYYASQPTTLQPPTTNYPPPASQLPPGVRKGFFQKLFFTGTYLPRLENDSLGASDLETGIVLGIPFFRVTAPLLITPRFAVHYLDGPATPDLPARVYDAEVNFRHIRKFGESPWAMMAAVTLGQYSDFEKGDADAFRVTGQAFAIYESSPATKWIMGVVYLNRQDIKIVPALGLIYEPNPDIKFEATLPRPRISWRLNNRKLAGGTLASGDERRAYVAGEFGGGIWSIQRPTTLTQDLLTYSDFRVLMGIERTIVGGLSHRVEAGYVFGRELEFASVPPDVELDDSLFVRAGLTY